MKKLTKVTITIETINDAFSINAIEEVSRILSNLVDYSNNFTNENDSKLMDINGYHVGNVKFTHE